jgi:hypothetical protein
MPNYFRTGIYTGMWGWGIRREIWKLFELDLSNLKIQTILNSSIFWKKISSRQKNIWENRFNKVCSDPLFTWDFQMQFLVFRYDLPVLSPFFRSLDNIGFNSELSTHTKDKKPKYYFGETDYRCIKGVKRSKLIFKIMNYCDSFSDLIPFLKKNSVLKYFLTK